MKRLILLTIAALALALTPACDKKEDGGADGTSAEAETTAEADEGEEEAEEEEAAEMTPEQFAAAAPGNVCTWITTCKNQEITTPVSGMMAMIVGFGAMKEPAIQEKIKPINESMQKEERVVPNADECAVLAGAAVELMSFDGTTLQAKIDAGKIEFDGAKAAACADALKGELDSCDEEKTVANDIKMTELDKMMKTYEKELEAHFMPCEEMITGKVAADAECEEDYECAGEAKCQMKNPGEKDSPKVCIAAAAPAEEGDAKAN